MSRELKSLRKEIDSIDREIVRLLDRRAVGSKKIAGVKKGSKMEVYDPARETEVLKKVLKLSKGYFPASGLKSVYNEIFSASRALQSRTRVAFLGPVASYSHVAALSRLGRSTDYLPVDSIKDVFAEVEKGNADYGCVPIENSTEGAVNYTYDMFADSDLKIYSEILLKISHCLLSNEKRLPGIKRLYVHPQTRAQCRNYIESALPGVSIREVSSNSKAAMIAASEKGAAAIASETAASYYGIKVLAKSVQDMTGNYTRFFLLGRSVGKRTGEDKTSIMVSIKDKPGALFHILKPFEKAGINLTNIESRPSRKKAWDYYFFVDMEGHIEEEKVRRAVEEVWKYCGSVKVLGSYPRF